MKLDFHFTDVLIHVNFSASTNAYSSCFASYVRCHFSLVAYAFKHKVKRIKDPAELENTVANKGEPEFKSSDVWRAAGKYVETVHAD